MAKTPSQIASLARQHTERAIQVLVGIATNEDSNDSARVAAADKLLDRGWGKAVQPIDGDGDGGPGKVVIERVILDANG